MSSEFKLPELGEGVESGDVVRVLVSPGDTIKKDQAVLELETDKATIEVPTSLEGVVGSVAVKAGDKVRVGQVILTLEGEGEVPSEVPSEAAKAERAGEPEGERATRARPERPARGAREGRERAEAAERARRAEKVVRPTEEQPARPASEEDLRRGRPEAVAAPLPAQTARAPVAASPSVRRLARELGVDLDQVKGSGPNGRIGSADVIAFARQVAARAPAAEAAPGRVPLPDFGKWGPIERVPLRGIRRKTAEHLTQAWTIPHVTQHDRADVTTLEELRRKYAPRVEQAGGKLTLTAIVIKVVAGALRQFPQFNTAVDMANEEIVQKKYIHIGVAVDTDRGLLVPVIRDVETKNITELSVELTKIAEKARAGKLTLEEMQGSCFTVTNLGGIGGTYFSPIINYPEVAILGVSRTSTEPLFTNGEFVPRLLLPLSLSYDHRVIDGANAIRFLRWVIDALEQPFVMAL